METCPICHCFKPPVCKCDEAMAIAWDAFGDWLIAKTKGDEYAPWVAELVEEYRGKFTLMPELLETLEEAARMNERVRIAAWLEGRAWFSVDPERWAPLATAIRNGEYETGKAKEQSE